jgi:hypothetical protein
MRRLAKHVHNTLCHQWPPYPVPLGTRVYPTRGTSLSILTLHGSHVRGFSLRERRCSLRELYGTYANLSLIEHPLPGGGLTPTGMRVRIAERSTTKMRTFAERTATYRE